MVQGLPHVHGGLVGLVRHLLLVGVVQFWSQWQGYLYFLQQVLCVISAMLSFGCLVRGVHAGPFHSLPLDGVVNGEVYAIFWRLVSGSAGFFPFPWPWWAVSS